MLQYATFISLIFLSIRFPKSKVLIFLNSLFIWILLVFNYQRPDYISYLNRYNTAYIGDEIGYTFLCFIFRYFGFDFIYMIGFITFFNLVLLYLIYQRLTDKIALAIALYMANSFYDLIQIRNFTMTTIVLYCMKFLEKNGWGGER